MDGRDEMDEPTQPSDSRRRRLRSFMTYGSGSGGGGMNTTAAENTNRMSRLHLPTMPSLLRRFTSRGLSNAQTTPQEHDQLGDGATADSLPTSAAPQRRRPFSSLVRSDNRRFSYIHQETVTTISERETTYTPLDQRNQDDAEHEQEHEHIAELEAPPPARTPSSNLLRNRSRRMSWSNQMSNFFSNMTTPSSRAGIVSPSPSPSPLASTFNLLRLFNSPTQDTAASRTTSRNAHFISPRSRLSAHDPLPAFDDDEDEHTRHRDILFRPPTPARMHSREGLHPSSSGPEDEYERGYTPRRRRLRPQPVVGEPHDEDYIQRRRESDRRARRATWGPTNNSTYNPYSLRESSAESLSPPPLAELPGSTPPWDARAAVPRGLPGFLGRAGFPGGEAAGDMGAPSLIRGLRSGQDGGGGSSGGTGSGSMFRPAVALQRLLARRNPNRPDTTSDRTIPLAELTRLLASYAAQSSDRDYNGHQETTVDGGTITIYGIRRVNARQDRDGEGGAEEERGGLFPPNSPSNEPSEDRPPPPPLPRNRPRRIFNFIGPSLSEIDPLPPEFEETFERLRRTRRPRSMFGAGALRRNGVVEPDVSGTSGSGSGSGSGNDERAERDREGDGERDRDRDADGDETWIFYIVSAVLPEGHPLLSAPSLFTDNPTYEDMLFLDSFLAKPVASREDLARARGLYAIEKRSNGDLYAAGREQVEDVIEIGLEERCLVCLSGYAVGEEGRRLGGCGHFFHRECVDTWLMEGRNSCPLCRGEGVAKKARERRGEAAGPSRSGPASAREEDAS